MPRFKQVSTIRIFHIPTQEIYDIARGLFTVTNRSGHVGMAFSHPVYGWPKMSKDLKVRGIWVGKEHVRKRDARHGIKARGKKKFVVTTDSKHNLPVAPNLLARDFSPEAPKQTWTSDIAYIATDEGWLYLTAVLDLRSDGLAELLQLQKTALDAGPCHPNDVQATLDRGQAARQEVRIMRSLWSADNRGKVMFGVS